MLRTIVNRLPSGIARELKRYHFRSQISRGTFVSQEPEFQRLAAMVSPGDTVIDVGANFGQYTLRLAQLVGPAGRVIAFEPVLETFEILAANVRGFQNVTLLNLAASDDFRRAGMTIPTFKTNAASNPYQAAITANGQFEVMCVPIDALEVSRVRLIKIDAEGHDFAALKGAERLIARDHPAIVIESHREAKPWLESRGYTVTHTTGSPNYCAV